MVGRVVLSLIILFEAPSAHGQKTKTTKESSRVVDDREVSHQNLVRLPSKNKNKKHSRILWTLNALYSAYEEMMMVMTKQETDINLVK